MSTVSERQYEQLLQLRKRCHNQRQQYVRLQECYNKLMCYRSAESEINFYKDQRDRAALKQQRQAELVQRYKKFVNAIQDTLDDACPDKSNEIIAKAVRLYNDHGKAKSE